MDRPPGSVSSSLLLLFTLLPLAAGCSRAVYRQNADRDSYSAIHAASDGLLSPDALHAFKAADITPFEDSRFFDPFDPDKAPMPPDDPLSHKIMLEVDGHKGPSVWRQPGEPRAIQSDSWRRLLPLNKDGELVLTLKSAIRLGVHNSRDFQREREDLYLSALDVTFDRYQFAPKFAFGQEGRVQKDGKAAPGPKDQTRVSALTDGSVRWLSATGGEVLAKFANSFIWDFKSHGVTDTAGSLLNLSLVQPLLRLGGRERTLESLTQGERSLLANIRQMQQFQLGYLVRITTGRSGGEGPNRSGAVGATGLGVIAGSPSGRTVAPRADGFMGLLEEDQRIENLESNVARLRESMDQLLAAFDAGRIGSRLQVDQARLALFNSQSSLLSAKAAYQTKLDTFKVDLGLPPDLKVRVEDSYLARFSTSNPDATALDRRISDVLEGIRDNPDARTSKEALQALHTKLAGLLPSFDALHASVRRDLETLRGTLPARKSQLARLSRDSAVAELGVDLVLMKPEALDSRVGLFQERAKQHSDHQKELAAAVEKWTATLAETEPEAARVSLRELAREFSGLLLSISLNQTGVRLESATLPAVDLSEEEALSVARENRLDWMNARARLVDAWRRMGFYANALKAGADLSAAAAMGTVNNNAARFDARTASLRAGLRFDTPLERLAERNSYREAQIDYQRARRDFMLFEDRISQSLRNTLRIINLCHLNFELRRAAVQVAISQVDLARFRLEEPPRPGVVAQIGATTARDLVTALNDLLDAQNDFLGMRTGYEVLRLVLDFETGTMQTDADGLWMDPGAITLDRLKHRLPRWNPASATTVSAAPVVHRLSFRLEHAPTVR